MSLEGQSLVDVAETVLKQAKEPLDIYDLFDKVCEIKGVEEDTKPSIISQFYADMTISAKFVYTGENMWDIKENQKIELWEKDGSFYKEYTEVLVPEEYLEEEKPEPKAKVEPVIEEIEEVVVAEETVEEVVEPVIEPVAKAEKPEATEEGYQEYVGEEFDDELFDEYDEDFDEDKYNEYMDTYEDQYED